MSDVRSFHAFFFLHRILTTLYNLIWKLYVIFILRNSLLKSACFTEERIFKIGIQNLYWPDLRVILLNPQVLLAVLKSCFGNFYIRYYFGGTPKITLLGVKTIQLYASEAKVQKNFEVKTKDFFKAQTHSNFYDAALYSVIEGITSIALGLMIWYGSQQIIAGIVSIGVLVVRWKNWKFRIRNV